MRVLRLPATARQLLRPALGGVLRGMLGTKQAGLQRAQVGLGALRARLGRTADGRDQRKHEQQ